MTVHAQLQWVNGLRFISRAENSPAYIIDGDDQSGGACPMQLLLMSVAGCTAIDVVTILQKKRVELDDLEVSISGDEAEEHPQRFTRFRVEYTFYGKALKTKALE